MSELMSARGRRPHEHRVPVHVDETGHQRAPAAVDEHGVGAAIGWRSASPRSARSCSRAPARGTARTACRSCRRRCGRSGTTLPHRPPLSVPMLGSDPAAHGRAWQSRARGKQSARSTRPTEGKSVLRCGIDACPGSGSLRHCGPLRRHPHDLYCDPDLFLGRCFFLGTVQLDLLPSGYVHGRALHASCHA